MMRAGEAINAVPGGGELLVDMRADDEDAFAAVISSVPNDVDGVGLLTERLRLWPGMDAREISAPPLARAAELLGRPIAGTSRGGASDASNIAPYVPLAIDGLGPLGGSPIIRTSTSCWTRCGLVRRSPWPSSRPCSVTDPGGRCAAGAGAR